MPHEAKKEKMDGHQRNDGMVADDAVLATAGNLSASFDDLSVDVLANIFGFLIIKDVMRSRRINKKSMDAVKKTIVPPADFCVDSMKRYNAMGVMTEAMPNLQQITIGDLGGRHKYSNGEDPDEEWAAEYADMVSHDIEIISNFGKLRDLTIKYDAPLNGRYPFLFNSFPLLEKLSIKYCHYLKWDLEMLTGFPLLKELEFCYNACSTSNIISLRVIKDTLEKVKINECSRVEGNFMDLADFPHLKELDLELTAVTGDIRDIGENDFTSLESLALPKGVYGAKGSTLHSIAEATDLVRTIYLLKKKIPALDIKNWDGKLSGDSPDWYEPVDDYFAPSSSFLIRFVQAGSRLGYRWTTHLYFSGPCEVNWLDPEPDRESSDYAKYMEEFQKINSGVNFYRGFHQPPTQEEYNRLRDRFQEGGRWW